jgi:hypothetical protein
MTGLARRVLVALVFAALADLLLYGHALGAGLSTFALLLGALAWAWHRSRLRRAGPWAALWLLLACAAAVEPSATGALLLLPLGWAVLAMARSPEPLPFLAALARGFSGGVRGLVAVPQEIALARRLRAPGPRRPAPLWVYLVPLCITGLFALILLPANLVLERWAGQAIDRLAAALDPLRALLWVGAFAGAYGVLRFRARRRKRTARREPPPHGEDRLRDELRAALATLLCVNALFLALNVADLLFLWARFDLPEGMTYSAFAHRGAYRLIAGVVLAAATVEYFLRRGAWGAGSRAARGLAYALLAQDLLVTAGAALRLVLYAEAYGLTRFRVATVFWLALVAMGLVLIAIRIRGGRPFAFLLEANARSTVLVLSLWAVANVDGFVADWNVDRHLADPTRGVDLAYLRHLGPAALPALARLARSADADVATRARATLDAGLARARAENHPWTAWSLRSTVSLRDGPK